MIFNQGSGGGGGSGIKLASIAVTTAPTKTAYNAGETFDATGMVVTATYTNGATLAVGGYTVSPQTMTMGTTSVTIAYTEGGVSKTTTQAVTVSKVQVPVPTVSGTLTYDGTAQSPTIQNEPSTSIATRGGDASATNAGSYTKTYTLIDTANYEWATTWDGNLAWSIGKKATTISVSPSSVTLDADHLTKTATITSDGDGALSASTSDSSVATATVSGTTVTISNVNETSGTATITVSQAAGTNYLAASASISVTAEFVKDFKDATWAQISAKGAAGTADQYWDIGDMHDVTLNGTVGIKTYSNVTKKLFIAHFNYKSQNGVYLMGFKDAGTGNVLGMCDSNYNSYKSDGTKTFNMNHWGGSSSPYNTNYGGWKGCDLRYDILGSTNVAPSGYGSTPATSREGNDPSSYNIVSSPVANTLMAALESGLRQYMKSFTVYTDNKGNSSTAAANVTASTDYIVLPAEYEIFGTTVSYANENEPAKQEQLEYYRLGNAKITYNEDAATTAVYRWERSPNRNTAANFALVNTDGSSDYYNSRLSYALTPLLRVA